MRKFTYFIGILILGTIIGLSFSYFGNNNENGNKQLQTNVLNSQQTLAEKVLEKGEINAAYNVYPPGLTKDPNTGKLGGIFYDSFNKAASDLGIKVNWTTEVSWVNMIEGLKTGKYDIVASPVWINSTRIKQIDFSVPLYYSTVVPYVRANEEKIKSVDDINNSNVKIATLDGEMSSIIAKEQFPQAKTVALPQTAQISDALLNVDQGKADIAFVEPYLATEYLKNNPGSIKPLDPENPLRALGNAMMVKKGETEFLSMLNVALTDQINSGYLENLVKQYEPYPGAFARNTKGFQLISSPNLK